MNRIPEELDTNFAFLSDDEDPVIPEDIDDDDNPQDEEEMKELDF